MNSIHRNCKYSEEFTDPVNYSRSALHTSLNLQRGDKSDIDKIQLRIPSSKLIINKLRNH